MWFKFLLRRLLFDAGEPHGLLLLPLLNNLFEIQLAYDSFLGLLGVGEEGLKVLVGVDSPHHTKSSISYDP